LEQSDIQSTKKEHINQVSVENFSSVQSSSYSISYVKRSFDIIFSILVSPIALVIIFFVILVYPFFGGFSIFFSHKRVGLNGKDFNLHKIRTYKKNKISHLSVVDKDELEIVPVIGNFLRLSRIDELPQILNILKGEMSWIGPRPEQSMFVKDIVKKNPRYQSRHIVRPGITGLAQINNPDATFKEFEEKLKFDFEYICKSSPLLDFKIFLVSLRIIFRNFVK
jgi:lipopolysaccharide/colanic/teichoic acid biosynthesis glycosyltransferase|tara:strand:- start:3678 stop:4346 length:669 start_codon:yes stop_codon:yes gene_type:complete